MSGYDAQREYKCVCCGKSTMATKFASASKVKCAECKSANRQPNPEIISNINTKSTPNKTQITGDQKESKCIACGAVVMIGKFASHANTLCPECKGENSQTTIQNIKIDMSRLDKSRLPSLDELYILPSVVGNTNLRNVECPACRDNEEMKIIKINDGSPEFGLVITYQCTKCFTLVSVSEQCGHLMIPARSHTMFNYRGEEIKDLSNCIVDTRLRNSLDYLLGLLEKHNIPVEGIEIPEVMCKADKNIDKGFTHQPKIEIEEIHEEIKEEIPKHIDKPKFVFGK